MKYQYKATVEDRVASVNYIFNILKLIGNTDTSVFRKMCLNVKDQVFKSHYNTININLS